MLPIIEEQSAPPLQLLIKEDEAAKSTDFAPTPPVVQDSALPGQPSPFESDFENIYKFSMLKKTKSTGAPSVDHYAPDNLFI